MERKITIYYDPDSRKFFVNTTIGKDFSFREGVKEPYRLQADIDEALEQVKAGRIFLDHEAVR